jgi:hypothetical protein
MKTSKEFDAMEDIFHIQVEDELFGQDWLKCFTAKIPDANLNAHQKADLLQVQKENNKVFVEILGTYPHKKVHIGIDPNAKPVHSRPYPVP